ncbi:MAG: hypothetical protein ACO1N0_03545 [Fluviicola sp.]
MKQPWIRTRVTRKILVNNRSYFWTIRTNINTGIIYCTVGLSDERNQTFEFLCFGGPTHERTPMYNSNLPDSVDSITPGLVRAAIEFSNAHVDWKNSKETWITYSENGFSYSEKLTYWQWECRPRSYRFEE